MDVQELNPTEVANVIGEMWREIDRLRLLAIHSRDARLRSESHAHAHMLEKWADSLRQAIG